ncbi:MAG: ACT domain-containing protein [Aliiglaciecola sp.]|uniref:ACT domain-containing protein n=1 Tax=Aliiglaciecola sp. M165 TaxID=2593649 RepID=UPI00117D9FF4|nr:ACT domain-containing protein [Aliiglaciecola sp. M165]TRY31919.1 ACT domain-containing protein [Aliiglaciecola sp. M165]
MSGETNLDILLKSMSPQLNEGEFVFVSIENGRYGQLGELAPIAMFMETEGMTLVVPKSTADDSGFSYNSTFCCITLTIHSSLDAVGLTAAFASKLAEKDISANVIAGYYHDHIFVQSEKSEQAMSALNEFRI